MAKRDGVISVVRSFYGKKVLKKTLVAAVAANLVLAGAAHAAPLDYDQDVTTNLIFGSGNANGGFTVAQDHGIEIGLRGKVRFDENNSPQNVFNSNGDGSYTDRVETPRRR